MSGLSRGGVRLRYAACVAVLFAASSAPGAEINLDESFPASDLLFGKSITAQQCAAVANAAWVTHRHGTECVRYFPSANIEGAKTAVIFFHGDRVSGRRAVSYGDNTVRAQLAYADRNAKIYGVPYVMVGRAGAYGSSGEHHLERRRPKAYYSMNAAVDAIKARYGLEKVVLAGQSGGATTVAALLTLGRSDVKCAAASSGNYSMLELAEIRRGSDSMAGIDTSGYSDVYDPIQNVDKIPADRERRIFIIGDPHDQNTVFHLQRKFAERVVERGHHLQVIEAAGRGSQRHGLSHVALAVAGWCARDLPDPDIAKRAARFAVQSGAEAVGTQVD